MNGSTRRSIAFSVVERYSSIALSLVATVILSRLLTPEDFGIFSIAMAFVVLTDTFRDFGAGNYLVQERQLTDEHLRSTFTAMLAISLLCALVFLLGTPAVATLYDDSRFRQLMPLFAVNLVLGPFSLPGMSLLRRNLEFDIIAAINLLAATVNLAVVVILASLGHGVMSLGWATLASSITRTVAVGAMRPCFTVFRISLRGWGDPFKFGVVSTATSIINVLHDQLPQLLIGRLLGLSAVGLLGRATSLCQLPDRLVVSALSPVLLPALSEQARAGLNLKPAYLLALSYMSALQWPILLCLALLAEPAILILYGHQWLEVASLTRIMALASLTMFPAFMTYPILVALGRVRDTLSMSLISLPPSILLILVAAPFGLQAVAATQLVNAPLQVFVAVSFIRRQIGVSWMEIAGAVRGSLVVALSSMVVPAVVVAAQGGFSFGISISAIAFALAGAAAGWLVGIALVDHPLLGELRNVTRFFSRRLSRST